MTQERRNKLVCLLTLAVHLCTRCNHSLYEMAFLNSWDLSCVNACHLRLGSSAACVPGFLCCYRTDRVASAAVAVSAAVPSGTLFLLIVRHNFSLLFFFKKFFSTHSIKEVRIRQWRKLRSACFRALPIGRVDERCDGKRQQAVTKQGWRFTFAN